MTAFSALDGPYIGGNNYSSASGANAVLTFSPLPRAVYAGATGNLHVQFIAATPGLTNSGSGTSANALFVAVPAGTTIPIRVNIIYSDTTANNLVLLF